MAATVTSKPIHTGLRHAELCCKGSSKNSPGLTAPQRRAGGGVGLAGSQGEEKWDATANPKEESRAVSPNSMLHTCQLWLMDTLYPLLHPFSSKYIALQLVEHLGSVLAGKGSAGPLGARAGVVLPQTAQPGHPGSLCPTARPAPVLLIYKPASAQWGGFAQQEGLHLLQGEKHSPVKMPRTSAGGKAKGWGTASGPTASLPTRSCGTGCGICHLPWQSRTSSTGTELPVPLQGDAIPWILRHQGPADTCVFPSILHQTRCPREDATRNRKHIIASALPDYLTARFCRITAHFGFILVIKDGVSNSTLQDNPSPSN